MSGYNAKNYTEQGGDVTHIGGKLVIEEGAEVEGLESGGAAEPYVLPAASEHALGGVKARNLPMGVTGHEVFSDGSGNLYSSCIERMACIEDAADAEDLKGKFNTLLAELKRVDIMDPYPPEEEDEDEHGDP